jgi:hypothetical protein
MVWFDGQHPSNDARKEGGKEDAPNKARERERERKREEHTSFNFWQSVSRSKRIKFEIIKNEINNLKYKAGIHINEKVFKLQ